MNFSSIDIQGSILSSDLFGKIRSEQAGFQQGKDFSPALTTAKLKDEISLAWQDAKGQWTIFQNKLKRLDPGESAATETRSFWILPLLSNLGYDFQYLKSAEELNGKSFWINNRDNNIGGFPLFIAGCNESLDRRSENKTLRVSPHALVQEYLNYSEHLYGLVTNGKLLRLLRDASRLTRLSYLEFNLEKIMEEDLYSDFVIFYRLLHVSRMPQQQDGGAESIIEKYHQEGLEAGATIRSKLGDAVKESILALAKGFVNHPDNSKLRQAIANGQFEPDEFYKQQLRMVYRLLFLFVIEERNLVYSESKDPDVRRFSQIYYNYFSLQRLRKLAKNLPPPDSARHYDLWMGLINTFALFEEQQIGEKMGIMALQGALFSYNALTDTGYDLHQCRLGNDVLLRVIKALGYFENDQKLLIAVNYGGLDVEEFGSVYEGLLELKLKIEPVPGSELFSCTFDKSSERSSSGSHYTPEELVQPLIKHSLDYIIADRLMAPTVIAIPNAQEKQSNVGNERVREKQTFPAKPTFSEIQSLQKHQLLSIRVCDVACGSGHILLSAARKIALALARVETSEEQPNPKAIRQAMREVIRHCIYGVDKNPLAVELCKVAFWLESYNPGEPLGFLDHHIKCGDSIVGLAHREELENGIPDEAFKTLPGDEKEVAQSFLKKNKLERNDKNQTKLDFEENIGHDLNEAIVDYRRFDKLPERNPEDIKAKQYAFRKFESATHKMRLQQLADAQIAQFFIPKITVTRDKLITDAEYRAELSRNSKALGGIQNHKFAYSSVLASKKRFFHWFLEFPEIMNEGGFDCILGNPPFLGGQKLSTFFGNENLKWIHYYFAPASGTCDFVAYFFRRAYEILKIRGFQSLISTNTICQGDTKVGGLDFIIQNSGKINHAVRSMKWPGLAAVEVSLVTIYKGQWQKKCVLNQNLVETISSYLDDSDTTESPEILKQNEDLSFVGSYVLGKGFVLETYQAELLMKNDPKNKDVIFPYLNGDDLNTNPDQMPSRWIINFFNWPLTRFSKSDWFKLSDEEKNIINKRLGDENFVLQAPHWYGDSVASDYPDCLEIVQKYVKPERDILVGNPTADDRRKRWWQFARQTLALYNSISNLERYLAISRVTKNAIFSFQNKVLIASEATVILALENGRYFSILNSTINDLWAWKNSSTLGGGTLRYSGNDAFETYPFPQRSSSKMECTLDILGDNYSNHRTHLMLAMQLGLTKTYNAFHAEDITATNLSASADLTSLDKKAIEKQYGKEVWNLWNHLQKSHGTCTFAEAVAGIVRLRELHVEMDQAVLEAYGWLDVNLRHDFYEVDYLPENDRVRYTIHTEARKEILKRLLVLNHKIHEEEIKQGLHKKADVEKFYAQKGQPVPQNIVSSDTNPKKKRIKKENIQTQAAQRSLFDDVNNTIMKEFSLHEGIYSIGDTAGIINQPYDKVRRWFLKLSEANYEGLSDSAKTDIENRRISFHGLVELVIIGELLEAGVKARKIFKARLDLSSIINKPYPFATSDVKDKLKVSGSDIIFDFEKGLVTLDGSRQFNFEFIREFFAEIEFKSGIAIRLLPAKGFKRIQINPKAAGGRPAFVSQKDVKVETILRFYKGPDSVEEIIEDYGISEEDIKAALAYQS